MSCPDDNALAEFLQGALLVEERARLEGHVDTCDSCRRAVAALANASAIAAPATPGLEPGTDSVAAGEPGPGATVGRYLLLRPLGAGAMGVVYSAYDPDLDRKVALKLLRGGDAPGRLRHEAQALARLSHPNVVAVHEVGEHEGRDFIAMEYVEGSTLAAWLHVQPRRWREILAVSRDAASGLAAAHRAGLVHRDVKPTNILIGEDGRGRVTDFGLATALGSSGEIAGTPAYMAPEQRAGTEADGRADQYALCATLYEALYGCLPRPEGDPPVPRVASSGHRVPSQVRRLLARGLAADPAARHVDMESLFAALSRDPVARSRRAVAIALLALALVPVTIALTLARSTATPPCGGAGERWRAAWNGERKSAARRAFEATGLPHAGDTYARAAAVLDRYGRAWTDAYTETCRATHVRGEQSEALLDARMICLRRRLQGVVAVAELFSRANAEVVERAAEVAHALASVEACGDVESLAAQPPLPKDPDTRARIDELAARLAEARALDDAGLYAEALERVEGIPEAADDLGYALLEAEARFLVGGLRERAEADAAEAVRELDRAVVSSAVARDDDLTARIWLELLYIVGARELDRAAAERLRITASAAVERAGGPPALRGALAHTAASVALARGEPAAAVKGFERALALRRERLTMTDPRLARTREGLCEALRAHGSPRRALPHCEAALDGFQTALGAAHPVTASAHLALASTLAMRGEYEPAELHMRRGVELLEANYGERHARVASGLKNLSVVLEHQGRTGEALAVAERALEIRKELLPSDHPRRASTLADVGYLRLEEGDLAGARAALERAHEIQRARLEPNHVDLGTTLTNLGDLAQREGRLIEAEAHYTRALATYEAALGAEHPELAYPLILLARARLARGLPRQAVAPLERALGLPELVPLVGAEARFSLAQALWDSGGGRPRALSLAREAAGAYTAHAPEAAEGERIEQWLRSRQPRRAP